MEVKHTQGPWLWTKKYPASNGEETWTLVGAGDYGILSCDGLSNSPQSIGRTGIYDADLIAAAPDMLELLEEIQEETCKTWCDEDDKDVTHCEECLKAKAVIAKAKGAA